MEFKVGTWNLDRSGTRRKSRWPGQLRGLERVGCDVWILSEAHRDQHIPGMHAHFSGRGEAPYISEEAAVAIWTRYASEAIAVSDPRLSAAVTVEVPVLPFKLLIYGTIVPYKFDGCQRGEQQWALHRKAVDNLVADCKKLRAAYSDHGFILAGDLNMSLSEEPWYGLNVVKELLVRELRSIEIDCCTLDDPRKRGIPRGNVDHIFASRDLAPQGLMETWYDSTLSDHNGVAARMTLISTEVGGAPYAQASQSAQNRP